LTKKWSQFVGGGTGTTGPVEASPAVVYNATLNETLVYDGSAGGVFSAFDATTGSVVWSDTLGGGVIGSPAVDAGTVYVAVIKGILYALNATTGAVQCAFSLPTFPPQTGPGHIQASPVVGYIDASGPIVFFGDEGLAERMNAGHEWAITGVGNRAGSCQQKWVFNGFLNKGPKGTKTGSWSSPALAQDSTGRWVVVFGSSNPDQAVYALNAADGTELWRFATQKTGGDQDVGAGPTISAPGVNGFADGVVYIDGKNKIEYAIDLGTGLQIWSFNMLTDSGVKTNSVSTASLVGNNVVVAYGGYVYDLDATTGAKVWRTSTKIGTILASVGISGAAGDQVVFIGDLSGNENGYKLSDGSLVFSTNVASKIHASAAVSDGMVFFASDGGVVYAFG
jgi:outer membrane protein assembly factor BamB